MMRARKWLCFGLPILIGMGMLFASQPKEKRVQPPLPRIDFDYDNTWTGEPLTPAQKTTVGTAINNIKTPPPSSITYKDAAGNSITVACSTLAKNLQAQLDSGDIEAETKNKADGGEYQGEINVNQKKLAACSTDAGKKYLEELLIHEETHKGVQQDGQSTDENETEALAAELAYKDSIGLDSASSADYRWTLKLWKSHYANYLWGRIKRILDHIWALTHICFIDYGEGVTTDMFKSFAQGDTGFYEYDLGQTRASDMMIFENYFLFPPGHCLALICGGLQVQPGVVHGGEDCATAVLIPSLPYDVLGTTAGYTNNYDFNCPYYGSTSPDVVYQYLPDVDRTVDIDLCWPETNYDTKVYVYQDLCGYSDHIIACNDDACPGYASKITGLDLFMGHTYYIVVDGYGGAYGDYRIVISEGGLSLTSGRILGLDVYEGEVVSQYITLDFGPPMYPPMFFYSFAHWEPTNRYYLVDTLNQQIVTMPDYDGDLIPDMGQLSTFASASWPGFEPLLGMRSVEPTVHPYYGFGLIVNHEDAHYTDVVKPYDGRFFLPDADGDGIADACISVNRYEFVTCKPHIVVTPWAGEISVQLLATWGHSVEVNATDSLGQPPYEPLGNVWMEMPHMECWLMRPLMPGEYIVAMDMETGTRLDLATKVINPTPQELTVHVHAGGQLHLIWEAVPGANYYYIYESYDPMDFTGATTYTTHTNEFYLPMMPSVTKLFYRVTAVREGPMQ